MTRDRAAASVWDVARSQWHKFYTSSVNAPAEVLFRLLSDLPNYGDWLPGSAAFGRTTDVTPYPVRRGSRYHDGKPNEPGKIQFTATIAGRFPLEVHRFGTATKAGRSHIPGPLLYVEVLPR